LPKNNGDDGIRLTIPILS